MRNLLFTLIGLFTFGITSAQDFGNWTASEGNKYDSITTDEIGDFNVRFEFYINKETGNLNVVLVYNGNTFTQSSTKIGYVTLDGGVTFKKGEARFVGETGLVVVMDLLEEYTGEEMVAATSYWFAINDQVFKFDTTGLNEAIAWLFSYEDRAANPFGAANPFKG